MTPIAKNNNADLISSLSDFAAWWRLQPDGTSSEFWFFEDDELPSNDLNRSVEPVGCAEFPQGCVRIMCDDDFYAVAQLPIKYRDLSAREIAGILWPDLRNPLFRPDSGDYWWTAIYDESLEVPGQPYELWCHVVRDGLIEQSLRYNVHETREAAVAAGMKVRASLSDGALLMWQIRLWREGTRMEEDLNPVASSDAGPCSNPAKV